MRGTAGKRGLGVERAGVGVGGWGGLVRQSPEMGKRKGDFLPTPLRDLRAVPFSLLFLPLPPPTWFLQG